MSLLTAKPVLPSSHSTTPPSSPSTHTQPSQTSPQPQSPIDIDKLLDIESVLDDADRFLSSSSPPVEAPTSSPNLFTVAIHHQTPPSSIAASSPTRRRVTFWDTPSRAPWPDGTVPQHLPSSRERNGFIPKPILKLRSPPALCDPKIKMTDTLKVLATDNVDNYLAQYIGLQDVLRMVDNCPQIDVLLTTSKKELLQFVARDMVVKSETTQLKLNLARNVVEFLPLLVNRPGFENGVEQECRKILDHSLDSLENASFTEHSGQSEKSRQSQGYQLSNLTRLHFEFWISQTLTNSLNEKHVRRMASVLEKYWQKAEDARKARDDDPSNTTESTYEKASSVQARLNVLQKLLYQVPALMTKDSKRWLMRLLEETISPHPEVRKTATDIGIATASDMGARKEVAQAMLLIMTNASKSKDRNYVQRRIVSLNKRLNGKDTDKDLVPDTWVFPLLYMRHPDVKAQAWSQLATYRDVLRNCFGLKDGDMKLACWDALRKLISSEFEDGYNKQRLQDFWQWMENWIPGCFEKVKLDADFNSPVFLSAVYTYLRVLQKAIPTTQHTGEEYLDQVWEVCVVGVMSKLDIKGTTRTHKILACRILAALFEKSRGDVPNDIWVEHQEFGTGLKDIQPFDAAWIRSHLPQIKDAILPFLEYNVTNSDGRQKNDELRIASTRMWVSLLQAVFNAENNMDFTSSGRKELKKVMANITNLLSSLWKSTISSPSLDLAIPRFFSFLFTAVDTLEPSNFAQNHIFSINGGSCDASSPVQKGQKAQSSCLHLTALMVKSLFSKAKLCENRHMLSSLSKLWSLCRDSRNTSAEKLEYLQSLSKTICDGIQKEGKADTSCKQTNLIFTPIFKLATDTFLTGPDASGSTFDRQPYDHTQRIIEIALGCTTPDWKLIQDLYSAMVSSIKVEALSLSKAKPLDTAYTAHAGDVGVALVLTVPHAKMVLHHLNDTRTTGSKATQKFLLDYATMVVKHDKRLTSRLEFKNGRGLFESAGERVVPKTIELHYNDLYRTINKAISTLYDSGNGPFKLGHEAMLAELIDTLVDHIRRTPATKQSIVTFIQEGISLLVKDGSSKVFTKIALAEKVDDMWKLAGDRMIIEVSSNKQKWLKEHDILLAAGLSSPRSTISTWARNFWHTQFDQADLLPSSEVAKALEQPQIVDPSASSVSISIEESDESGGSDSGDDGHALPNTAQNPKNAAVLHVMAGKFVSCPTVDSHIPSSPPGQLAGQYESPKKQVTKSLWTASQNDAPDHIPSTPILAPGIDDEVVPSSPIVSSERRRTLVSRNPCVQAPINSPRRFANNETIPSSPPIYINPKQIQREAAVQIIEVDVTGSMAPGSDGPQSSAASESSQPVKRGRGRPRKSDSQEVPSQDKQNAYMNAYHWRNLFHDHRPRVSSLFQDHDPDKNNRVWMETATELHGNASLQCDYIARFFGLAPFDIWANDCAPSHWSGELLEGLYQLALEAWNNGVLASEITAQVDEARYKRLENSYHKNETYKRTTVDDINEVIQVLKGSNSTSPQPLGKRKRENDPEVTSAQPRAKRNRSTPSQSQGSQDTRRYPKRNRLTPYKETSAVEHLLPKVNLAKTPKTPNYRGWAVLDDSPEPEPIQEKEKELEDGEEAEKDNQRQDSPGSTIVHQQNHAHQSGTRKRRRANEADLDEAETEVLPSNKRRKVDPPSTPDRNEIRSDPIVNITPGDPAGRKDVVDNSVSDSGVMEEVVPQKHVASKDKATEEDGHNTASVQGSKASAPIGTSFQSKGSPTAWLQKFKELLMDVPTYIWRPRDQQEVATTYSEVWERILDNTLREEDY